MPLQPLRLVVFAVFFLLVLGGGVQRLRAEIQVNPAGWRFPNVITAAKEAIRTSDRTPAVPGKETLLKGYRKADGTRFMTYEIEGRVFGVEIDTDGKPPFDYSILDTDGDGKFETKIPHVQGNKDRAYVPQWVIDHYFSLHPELKNPQGEARVPPPTLATAAPPRPKAAAAVEAPPPLPKRILEQPNP